jgi:Stage II sporulation protein E (SpoIIE)
LRGSILAMALAALVASTPMGQAASRPLASFDALSRPETSQGEKPTEAAFDASTVGSPVLLDRAWRVAMTTDPAAANPDYNDSTWPVRKADGALTGIPDLDKAVDGKAPGKASVAGDSSSRSPVWFRIHLDLAPNHGPLFLLIEIPVRENAASPSNTNDLALAVFSNGRLIRPEEVNPEKPRSYHAVSRLYDLGVDPRATSLVLALRTTFVPSGLGAQTAPLGSAKQMGFFLSHKVYLGHAEDLARMLGLWRHEILFERLPQLVLDILLLVLAAFLIALYFTQKGHTEYLWLALHELCVVPVSFVELAYTSALLGQNTFEGVGFLFQLAAAYCYFEFLVAFLALQRRWYIRVLRWTAPILIVGGPAWAAAGHSTAVDVALVICLLIIFLWMIGFLVFVLSTLIAAAVHRNVEAALLLVPLAFSVPAVFEGILGTRVTSWAGQVNRSPITLYAGPIPVHFIVVADFIGMLVIVLIVFVRFLRVQREQERAASELAAARSVQEVMIPREKIRTPGFEVESVYSPATEVGGDFFHIQSPRQGGLLVVIGDVAGKGLKAAMNVSMLMGALRQTSECHPARILDGLNRVLLGTESFTTCLAAWFGADGELIFASAGHLPPYLNGTEVSLPGGLPLGVLPTAQYEEIRLRTRAGDRILLLSDGVVEARQTSGEIFGFGRVENLSAQPAFYIADAARAFGQEDDISVLTIRILDDAAAA